ncbi:MAG: hypothetical protein U9N84_08785 [Actinomycetota bacterium]|nr:hypothetical protein [Actinomycetota bacterium]
MDGFYVAYEYGSGAAWAFVRADTADEVVAEFPELDVYETPPEWMTIDDLHQVRKHAVVEITNGASLDHILDASRRLSLAAAS